jgi:hypothetical protein
MDRGRSCLDMNISGRYIDDLSKRPYIGNAKARKYLQRYERWIRISPLVRDYEGCDEFLCLIAQ